MRQTLRHGRLCICVITAAVVIAIPSAKAAGDAKNGAQVFRVCAACHSMQPDENLTGPSLAGVWGRKAGTLQSFHRYSDALTRSGVIWNEQSLDRWLEDPAAFIPGNAMSFPGIGEATARADVIAYLRAVSEGKASSTAGGGMMGGGMMMGAPHLRNLKQAAPENRVKAVRYCHDGYTVTTAAGRTLKFWEFNLRFKTDSSEHGPRKSQPVLVPQGMSGDRAQLVFSAPGEISAFIKESCD